MIFVKQFIWEDFKMIKILSGVPSKMFKAWPAEIASSKDGKAFDFLTLFRPTVVGRKR